MFIHREAKANNTSVNANGEDISKDAQIIVAKNRHGAGGEINLQFIGEYMKFIDPINTEIKPNAAQFIQPEERIMEFGSRMNDMNTDPLGQPLQEGEAPF